MNSRISWQQLKGLLFVKGIFALLLAAPGMASATATINIKDTNYPIPSGAYFVSPDGKNTNSGKTPDSPWSVAKALASAPSGSTVVFRGGTYRNITANINKKLTLQAYPHEKPWVKGSVIVTDWVADRAIWRKDGWNYSFALNMGSEYIDPKYPMARYGDMVYINGVSLKQVASKAEVVPGTFYVDSASKQLYIGDNPAGKTVEATAIEDGLIIAPKFGSSTVIRGLGFAHYADSALNVQADFPRENEYVSKETGKVNSDDTLVSRLIRYHLYVKSRPATNRFDWKLTMADYLGAHEFLVESQYPSGNTLQENPMESDRTVIQKLTRSQRDALVDVLVSIFNTNRAQTPTQTPSASPSPSPLAPPPTTSNSPAKPSLPQPGDAQLLMP
jgi:hypothetical protein